MRGVVLHERWSYKRGGLTREVVLQERWFLERETTVKESQQEALLKVNTGHQSNEEWANTAVWWPKLLE